MKLLYTIKKLQSPVNINAVWDKQPWKNIDPITLSNYMGPKPDHFPMTETKLAYDDDALYVIFRVKDNYVRAVAKGHQERVCSDSCVEFFFTPSEDISCGYFNLEMNCGGTALFHHQITKGEKCVNISDNHLSKMTIAHSLPSTVDPEIQKDTTWTVEYRLPTDFLSEYAPTLKPTENVQWHANFYKCADHSSHSHWLTWSQVNQPGPDFHRPEDFATLEFTNEG